MARPRQRPSDADGYASIPTPASSEMTLLKSSGGLGQTRPINGHSDEDAAVLDRRSQLRPPSWMEVLLRALGLSILWAGWCKIRDRPVVEEPKQAVRVGRFVSWLTSAPHYIPVSGAIVLLYLNLHGYYIGGELEGSSDLDDFKLATLQFTAKLHEIMMQASLTLVVFAFLRHELVFGDGLPFGALAGGILMSNLGYLWSKEFYGVLKTHFRSKHVKCKVILPLVLGCLLFVTVGPSSAIAMRPRLDNWPAGGTSFYLNASEQQLWPTSLGKSDVSPSCINISLSTNCTAKDWRALSTEILPLWPMINSNEVMPESIKLTTRKSFKTLGIRLKVSQYKAKWTLATTQMSNLADALAEFGLLWSRAASPGSFPPKRYSYSRRFRYRKDVMWSIPKVYQPLTMAVCVSHPDKSLKDIGRGQIYAPVLETFCSTNNAPLLSGSLRVVPASVGSELTETVDTETTSPILQFAELPEETFGNSTIGAFVSLPSGWPGGPNLLACGLDSRWVTAEVRGRRTAVKEVVGEHPGWSELGTCGITDAKRIKVDREWASFLNPRITDHDRSVFQELASTISASGGALWTDNDLLVPMVENILAVMMTNGLATTKASEDPIGVLKGCQDPSSCKKSCADADGAWCNAIMPTTPFGYSETPIFDLPPGTDTSKMTRFVIKVDINGYAYNSRGPSSTLALVALAFYCTVAVGHVLYSSLFSRLSSSSWDTISELLAVAMQSQPTKVLRNTCAGIVSTGTFTHMVTVAKTGEQGDHLELQFGEPDSMATKVVSNDFYD